MICLILDEDDEDDATMEGDAVRIALYWRLFPYQQHITLSRNNADRLFPKQLGQQPLSPIHNFIYSTESQISCCTCTVTTITRKSRMTARIIATRHRFGIDKDMPVGVGGF